MDEYTLKHLQDIINAISDVERIFDGYPMRFEVFEKDDLRRWAVERKTEIMGEAMTRIRKHKPELVIPNGQGVIATRNRLIHSYEFVEPSFLWSLVIRHIPQLKKDILRSLKKQKITKVSLAYNLLKYIRQRFSFLTSILILIPHY